MRHRSSIAGYFSSTPWPHLQMSVSSRKSSSSRRRVRFKHHSSPFRMLILSFQLKYMRHFRRSTVKSTTIPSPLSDGRTSHWTSGGRIATNSIVRTMNLLIVSARAEILASTGETMDEESLPRKILAGELHYAKLWLVCVALRGVSWDKMPFEQRELAFQAKDAASNCLSNLLNSPTYR